MVSAYLEWQSGCIHLKEFSLPPAIFQHLATTEALAQKTTTQIFLVFTGYTEECQEVKIRPEADKCKFITTKVIDSLVKKRTC